MLGEVDSRFVLAEDVNIRIRTDDQAEVRRHRRAILLPPGLVRLLMAFANPRRIADVAPSVDLPEPQLFGFVERLCAAGILTRATNADSGDTDIRAMLRPDLLANANTIAELRKELEGGRLVLIPNAFREDFAAEVSAALDTCTDWDAYEWFPHPSTDGVAVTDDPFFHFSHHNLYDSGAYPPALSRCFELFASKATRELVQSLSGRDCGGHLQFSASMYLPGDYSVPHTDAAVPREVAYVWHLSKSWQPEWGGSFFWCPSNTYIAPSYNSLLMFNVVPWGSYHCVTPVSPYARGKRLTVNGWWTSASKQAEARKGIDYSPVGGVHMSRHASVASINLPADVVIL